MTQPREALPALGSALVVPVDATGADGQTVRRWVPSVVTRIVREETLGAAPSDVAYASDGALERTVTREALSPEAWEAHLRSVVELQVQAQLAHASSAFDRVRRIVDGKRQSEEDREGSRARADSASDLRRRLVDVVPVADRAVSDELDSQAQSASDR